MQQDTLALRRYFNKHFDEMVQVKENEMNLTRQRNARLRHIQDELNCLEELKESEFRYERDIIDPEYAEDEVPESIVTVEPHELTVTPYISPSEQNLLNIAAAEAERRRLEMLADDFRERALIRMMDGVLEIRWEDEIKKTPPAPHCLTSEKDPKDYTPEDLKLIYDYEQELSRLHGERERYRCMLLDEQSKTDQMMYDQVMKFNLKVGESLLEKLRVEFAIVCEDLKLLRNEQYQFERMRFSENEAKYLREMKQLRVDVDQLTEKLNIFEDILLGQKSKYEELSTKDRALDKQFKASFGEFAGQAVVDQAARVFRFGIFFVSHFTYSFASYISSLYRRRPKWQMRAVHTVNICFDMARRVIAADVSTSGLPLPAECYAYLTLLDQVDKFSAAPNLMDQNLWSILCKMRRIKIEVEFKVQGVGVSMSRAETAVNSYAREINAKKAKLAQTEKLLEELREERVSRIYSVVALNN